MRKIQPPLVTILFFAILISLISPALCQVHDLHTEEYNWDFEEGKLRWLFANTANVSTDSPHAGVYSGILPAQNDYIRHPTAGGVWENLDNITEFSFYGRWNGSGTHNVRIIVGYSDESYENIDVELTNSWAQYDVTDELDIPALGVYDIKFTYFEAGTGSLFIDDVVFTDYVPTPTPRAQEQLSDYVDEAVQLAFGLIALVFIVHLGIYMADQKRGEHVLVLLTSFLIFAIIMCAVAFVVASL